MLTRHANELNLRLERVLDIGCAEISYGELLRWNAQERVTVGIWRDLSDRWEEIRGEQEVPLLVGEASGAWVLVWGEGIQLGKDAWLKDVNTLAKRSTKSTLEAEFG